MGAKKSKSEHVHDDNSQKPLQRSVSENDASIASSPSRPPMRPQANTHHNPPPSRPTKPPEQSRPPPARTFSDVGITQRRELPPPVSQPRNDPPPRAVPQKRAAPLPQTPTVVPDPPAKKVDSPQVKPPKKAQNRHSVLRVEKDLGRDTSALDVAGLENNPKPKGVGDRFLQTMQQKRTDEHNAERDKIRERRDGGVEFMDKQIRMLITEMKRLNKGGGGGMASVPFGELFYATQSSMPALAACLAVAKKRGVIKYDGDVLMQGTHDNVILVLLKDEIKDSSKYRSMKLTPDQIPKSADESVVGTQNCKVCDKKVYPTEKVVANSVVMHKNCFRCIECKKVLKLQAYAYGGGKFYCEPHFQANFQKSGGAYNF